MRIMSDAEFFGIHLMAALFAIAMVAMFFRSARYNDRGVIQAVEPYAETDTGSDIDGSLTADLPPICEPRLETYNHIAECDVTPATADGGDSSRFWLDTIGDTMVRANQDKGQDTSQSFNMI